MMHLPRNRQEWVIATVSAFAGFFGGQVIISTAQIAMKRLLGYAR